MICLSLILNFPQISVCRSFSHVPVNRDHVINDRFQINLTYEFQILSLHTQNICQFCSCQIKLGPFGGSTPNRRTQHKNRTFASKKAGNTDLGSSEASLKHSLHDDCRASCVSICTLLPVKLSKWNKWNTISPQGFLAVEGVLVVPPSRTLEFRYFHRCLRKLTSPAKFVLALLRRLVTLFLGSKVCPFSTSSCKQPKHTFQSRWVRTTVSGQRSSSPTSTQRASRSA